MSYPNSPEVREALMIAPFSIAPFSIAPFWALRADRNDPGMLDVVGFDTATPQLISDFARGPL
jgi:hypothetical protein